MAGGIKRFLDMIKLGNDEDDLYDDDFIEEEEEEKPVRRVSKHNNSDYSSERTRRSSSTEKKSDNSSFSRRENLARPEKERPTSSGKVVSMKSIKGMEVCIQKPTSFEDSEEICDMLLKGQAVVVNLEGFDSGDAQRIIDLLYGCIYAIGGKLNQISKYIFMFSPDNVDVLGDLDFDLNSAPTVNNEF
ncbi:MAG: cell division protein SepF [Lachnospiraceae bacterium]|nr:cell division protein SepF [Lachnospiraceae bacterium]